MLLDRQVRKLGLALGPASEVAFDLVDDPRAFRFGELRMQLQLAGDDGLATGLGFTEVHGWSK